MKKEQRDMAVHRQNAPMIIPVHKRRIRMNYQGILRDSSDSPLTGDYDMRFQFFNVDTGGSAILIDDHLAAGTGAVTVTDGLFNAHLGGGDVYDGPAGGTYDELYKVFRDYGTVYLEVQVYNTDTPAWETLSPRIQIVSAAYSLNTDHLDGTNSDQFLRSDTGDNFTSGILAMNGGTTLDVNGTLQMDGTVTKATTNLVTNFNADYLDGLHSSSFSLTGHNHPGTDITSPVSDATNASVLDGYDSTQFLRSDTTDFFTSGTLSMNGGTTLDVNGTLRMDGTVTKATTSLVTNFNADYLDGLHSSSFANSSHNHPGTDITSPVASATDSDTLDGYDSSYFLNTSSTAQTKTGRVKFDNTGGTGYGIEVYGPDGGGYFKDSDGFGEARIAIGSYGVQGYSNIGGGRFWDINSTGEAFVGYGDYGVYSYGDYAGGYFYDSGATGYALVGYGNRGIHAVGSEMGGYFKDSDHSGYAHAGYGNYGVYAGGTFAGGYFYDTDSTGYAYVGYGLRGIQALGTEMGGYFKDSDQSGYAYVGFQEYGIRAFGNTAGGYFEDEAASGYALVGYGNRGIHATGTEAGGYFKDYDHSGYAYVGHGDYGISGYGLVMGGYFEDTNNSAEAWVGFGDNGIRAFGNAAGGYFESNYSTGYGVEGRGQLAGSYFRDIDSGNWCRVGYSSYKDYGTGTPSSVQNHPYSKDQVIVYSAPEGDEAATYTRGTANLINGEARVPLGETFKWVTNPDIGLTAYVTPQEDCLGLYVESVSTTELVVRELNGGASNVPFDFVVFGLRIGFEETSIVQNKIEESYIPSMKDHRDLYEQQPDLRQYNALERFKGMHFDKGEGASLDLSASLALKNAIEEYDHEIHGKMELDRQRQEILESVNGSLDQPQEPVGGEDHQGDPSSFTLEGDMNQSIVATVPMDEDGNIHAKSFRSISPDLTGNVPISEPVEVGDVLVVDPTNSAMMRLGDKAADPAVVGIVAGEPGIVLGGSSVDQIDASATSIAEGTQADNSEEGLAITETELPQAHAPVALSGIVLCKVDAGYGSIQVGDLLTTSPTKGHAMRSDDHASGTILGKALEPFDSGTGLIKVIVMLR
jgi:hypothetical protein